MNCKILNVPIKRLIIILIMLVVVVAGGTFAWFTYSSRQSALVLTISDIHDSRIKITPYQINETIIPSTTYTGGVYSNVEIISQYENMPIKLFYKINSLDAIIIDNGLAYTIVNVETDEIIVNDYFSNLINTSMEIPSEVTILDDVIPVSKYRVYLWLDSSRGNQNEVVNTTLDMELNTSIGYEDFVVILNENGGSFGETSTLITDVGETEYTVSVPGTYKLEVWGAQGGYGLENGNFTTATGGYGGYSIGNAILSLGDILYVNVGGQGGNGTVNVNAQGGYNGGGNSWWDNNDNESSGAGGGATHIATVSGELSTLESYKGELYQDGLTYDSEKILIVAGGGAGGSWTNAGGSGGGYMGTIINNDANSQGTQASGYAFGQGGEGTYRTNTPGGGGGGGFYGGKGGLATDAQSGSGGSGYIGSSLLSDKAMYCYNCSTSSNVNTLTYSTTNVSETPTANYAKSGAGAARITMLNASKAVTSGLTYGTLPTPTRDGYTFKEWNTKSDESGETITSDTIVNLSGDTTLYAIWELKIYTISYDANGGNGAPESHNKYYATPINLSDVVPTRTNYTFLGWSTSSTATSATYAAGGEFTGNYNLQLYAVWKGNSYTVALNANGGEIKSVFTTVGQSTYTIPVDGTYKLEVWGAQGGKSLNNGTLTTSGGYGGYAVGSVSLDEGIILYVNVGGQGGNGVKLSTASGGYNGGGSGSSDGSDDEGSGGGGGATHISTASGVLSSLSSKKDSILIVAGGGGGASWTYAAGHGGGIYGGTTSVTSSSYPTQTSGYSFGQGQNGSGVADSDGVAGGGGGYYGGYSNNVSGKSSGTGGSGYIGNSSLTNKAMYCYNCTTSSSVDTLTYSTANVSSAPTSNYAKSGAGAAKIKMLNGSKVVTYALTYGTLPTPTRDGYTFKEWNTKSDGSGTTITSLSIVNLSANTTLYAIWEEVKTYTISYNANGGSGAPSAQTKYHDTTLTLSSTVPTKSGYIFAGWSTSSTATSATYKAGGSYTANAGATLYAVWKQPTTTSETYLQVDLTNDYGYDAGYILVYYSTSYNPVTNQTTVNLPSNWNNLRLSGNSGTTGYFDATITIRATDSGNTATSRVTYTHTANGGYSVVYSSPSPSSVVVQHSNTIGTKQISVSCSASYTYDYGSSGSDSESLTVGTYSG